MLNPQIPKARREDNDEERPESDGGTSQNTGSRRDLQLM